MTRRIEINGERVTIEISESLDAQQLRELLLHLGEARSEIANDPPSPQGLPVQATIDPAYWAGANLSLRASLLYLRDKRFGWVGYVIPAVELARLIGILTNHLQILTGETPSQDAGPVAPRH